MILSATLSNFIEVVRPKAADSFKEAPTAGAESFDQTLSRYDLSNDAIRPDDVSTESASVDEAVEPVEAEAVPVDEVDASNPLAQDEVATEPTAEQTDDVAVEAEAAVVEGLFEALPVAVETQPTATTNVESSLLTEDASKLSNATANIASTLATAAPQAGESTQANATQTLSAATTEAPVAPVPATSEQSLDQGQPQTTPDRPQILTVPASSHETSTATTPVVETAPLTPVMPTAVTPVTAPQANAVEAPMLTQTLDQGNDSANATRIARGLQNAVTQRGGAITLRLTPADMGTVRIQMHITGTTVSAQFYAETQQGHTLLSQQLTQLRQTLESQGLQVDRLGVAAMQTSQSSSSQTQQQNDSSQHESRTDDGRSRGSFDQREGRSRDERSTGQTFDFEQWLQDGNER